MSTPVPPTEPKARPEFAKGTSLKGRRTVKLLVYGEAKVGKTSFVLSLFPFFEQEGMKPENVRVYVLDCDDGMQPLIDRGVVKTPWLESLYHIRCDTFDDILFYTEQAIPLLKKWGEEHGPLSAWFIVDNMKSAWDWARVKFAIDVYGKPEHELALERRIEAQSQNKKMLPTFNQLTDYAVINPLHNNWIEGIKVSGVNFILATPEDSFTPRNKDGSESATVIKPGGQKGNTLRVDDIIRLHTVRNDQKGSAEYGKTYYLADLEGSRTATLYFVDKRGTTFSQYMKWIATHREE